MRSLNDYQLRHTLELDNEFCVDGRDFAGFVFPKPEVKGWSTLIGESLGSVTVEAEFLFTGEKYPKRFTLARTLLADERAKTATIKHYNALVKEWNKDNKGNWLREIRRSVEYVASHHEKKLVDSRKFLDIATANLDWLVSEEV